MRIVAFIGAAAIGLAMLALALVAMALDDRSGATALEPVRQTCAKNAQV